MKSYFSLSLLILITACSTSATRTMNNDDDQNGGGSTPPVIPSSPIDSDPMAFLQNLPKLYTDNLPITSLNRFEVFVINEVRKTATFILQTGPDTVLSKTIAELETDVGIIPNSIRFLFDSGNNKHANIVTDTGNPKLFVLTSGSQTIYFGYFDVNGSTKIYSYDPVNNKLGALEAALETGVGTVPANPSYLYGLQLVSSASQVVTLYVFPRQ